MDEATPEPRMTEVESIEFNRRIDLAFAVMGRAAKVLNERDDVAKQIESASKPITYAVIGLTIAASLGLHAYLAEHGSYFNWGTLLVLFSGGMMVARNSNILWLWSRKRHCDERLDELEMLWKSVGGGATLWEVRRFVNDGDFDTESEAFRDWWTEKQSWILQRVCGRERGAEFAELWFGRENTFKKLRDWQHKQSPAEPPSSEPL